MSCRFWNRRWLKAWIYSVEASFFPAVLRSCCNLVGGFPNRNALGLSLALGPKVLLPICLSFLRTALNFSACGSHLNWSRLYRETSTASSTTSTTSKASCVFFFLIFVRTSCSVVCRLMPNICQNSMASSLSSLKKNSSFSSLRIFFGRVWYV